MAKGKKTGGRVAGTPNKDNQSVMDKLASLKCDPIEGMAEIAITSMADGDYHLAFQCFKELGQYVAPKRKSIEVSGDLGVDIRADIMVGFRDIPLDPD